MAGDEKITQHELQKRFSENIFTKKEIDKEKLKYTREHEVKLNDIDKLNKLLFSLQDSKSIGNFTLTNEQNSLIKSLDDNSTPNFKNFKTALHEISANHSLPIDEKTKVLNYHMGLTGAYVMRDITEKEYQLLETYLTTSNLTSSAKSSLEELDIQKTHLNQLFNIKNIPQLPDIITPQIVKQYLKSLVAFDKNLMHYTSATVEHDLSDRLPRNNELKAVKDDTEIGGSHGVQKYKSTLLHDFGENYFIKTAKTGPDASYHNLELLLESAADKIISVAFPKTVAQVRNVGEVNPRKSLQNKAIEDVYGLRSKMTPGIEFYKFKGNVSKIENYEEFVSKSMVLLDPDCHGGNGFVHNNRLTKIDNGRTGWLNFKNINQLSNFIKDRFIDDYDWKRISLNQEKLIQAMVNDLNRIDKNLIQSSLEEAGNKFDTYPVLMPNIDNMRDYMKGKWNTNISPSLNTLEKLTNYLVDRFEQQHNLQRAYVIDQTIKLNIKLDGLPPLDYIRQPGRELFLKAYNTILLKPGEKSLTTTSKINTAIISDDHDKEGKAMFTSHGNLKPVPANAKDAVDKSFKTAAQLVKYFNELSKTKIQKSPNIVKNNNDRSASKTSNNRGGYAR